MEYPALSKQVTLRSRAPLVDFDYIEKLSTKEKAWLNNFVEEEIHANLNHPGKKLNRTKEDARRIYNKNNARNRDTYTIVEAAGKLSQGELGLGGDFNDMDIFSSEDTIIELLDAKRSLVEKLANVDDSKRKGRNKRNKSK